VANHGPIADLRYLHATQLEHPSGTMAGLLLKTEDDQPLGALDGVLLEPSSGRVRYYVVKRRGTLMQHRYLLDADNPTVLNAANGTLRVDAGRADLERVDLRDVPVYSQDADLHATQPAA
jgi:hypothetical protein